MAADVGASMESRYIRWVLSSLEYSEFVASIVMASCNYGLI